MTIVALYNLKGGVGKTAAAVNLSYLAAREGRRSLLWDLDPQGAASYYFRMKPRDGHDASSLLKSKKGLARSLRSTDFDDLDLIPADVSYRHMDLELNERKRSTTRLRRLLKHVKDDYEVVFLDCAPSMSVVAENVFNMAGVVLVPLIPTHLSLRAFDQLARFHEDRDGKIGGIVPFFSMVDRRKRLHRELVVEFAGNHPDVLPIYIPYASQIEQMGEQQAPVNAFADASPGGRAFRALWSCVWPRLGLAPVD